MNESLSLKKNKEPNVNNNKTKRKIKETKTFGNKFL